VLDRTLLGSLQGIEHQVVAIWLLEPAHQAAGSRSDQLLALWTQEMRDRQRFGDGLAR
jgi:hypothetical protein